MPFDMRRKIALTRPPLSERPARKPWNATSLRPTPRTTVNSAFDEDWISFGYYQRAHSLFVPDIE